MNTAQNAATPRPDAEFFAARQTARERLAGGRTCPDDIREAASDLRALAREPGERGEWSAKTADALEELAEHGAQIEHEHEMEDRARYPYAPRFDLKRFNRTMASLSRDAKRLLDIEPD